MPVVYFLRHGQTDWNVQGRIQGHLDVPINALGRTQAARNGSLLNELIADKTAFEFISSPLLRTRQTMEVVRSEMGLSQSEYRTDDRLREIYAGRWSGLFHAEAQEKDPDYYRIRGADMWNVPHPCGESMAEVSIRVREWWASLIQSDAVVVSHGGVSRCLRGYLLNLSQAEILSLDVPQDRVLMIEGDALTWL